MNTYHYLRQVRHSKVSLDEDNIRHIVLYCLAIIWSLDRFFLNGEKGFGELLPATGYGPIKGRTNKGELDHPHVTHQTVQMDEMAGIILAGNKPVVPVDGEEALKDLKIIDAIFLAVKTGKKVALKL